MTFESALRYHQKRLENGEIYPYTQDGKVLGYYERTFDNDKCFLKNVYVAKDFRQNGIFKKLCRHFFDTMPDNIKYVTGEKQSVGGKPQKVLITKERRNGKH